jgi:DNA-directed RNA polymerase specialized sigma24 family protein
VADESGFDEFVGTHSRTLWRALVPVAGPDIAADAVADALAYAWSHWERISQMDNPAGYVFTMARRDAIRAARRHPPLPLPDPVELPDVAPGLIAALNDLTEMQRQVVYLVEGFGWGLTDTARILDVSVSTVRNHLARGMARLRASLEVQSDA